MKLEKLDYNQVKNIYETHLVNDFIEEERKPLVVINILMQMGIYHCYGLFEGEILLAYAFFCEAKNKNQRAILLDYLVVLNGSRNQGIGSKLISIIKETLVEYDMVMAEVELTEEYDSEQDFEIRKKRQAFYLRNGWKKTDVVVDLFGVKLQIFILPTKEEVDESYLKSDLDEIYDSMFYDQKMRKHVKIMK